MRTFLALVFVYLIGFVSGVVLVHETYTSKAVSYIEAANAIPSSDKRALRRIIKEN